MRGAHGPDHHGRPGPAPRLHRHALRRRTFTTHYHNQPLSAANLQHRLTAVATKSLYAARVNEVRAAAGAGRELARLYGGKAKHASRWKTAKPTEGAYQLSDEFYRYAARRDLGLPPTRDRVLR